MKAPHLVDITLCQTTILNSQTAFTANIRRVAATLTVITYYCTELVTLVKSFTIQVLVVTKKAKSS